MDEMEHDSIQIHKLTITQRLDATGEEYIDVIPDGTIPYLTALGLLAHATATVLNGDCDDEEDAP